jgi:hypothetical protein
LKVLVAEDGLGAAVAALSDVMRHIGKDCARGRPCGDYSLGKSSPIKCTVTVVPLCCSRKIFEGYWELAKRRSMVCLGAGLAMVDCLPPSDGWLRQCLLCINHQGQKSAASAEGWGSIWFMPPTIFIERISICSVNTWACDH